MFLYIYKFIIVSLTTFDFTVSARYLCLRCVAADVKSQQQEHHEEGARPHPTPGEGAGGGAG